jgi:hypothetical protein
VVVALLIGIPYLAGILSLTLAPERVEKRMPAMLDLVLGFAHRTLGWGWLGFDQLEFSSNVLVFLPLGILAFIILRNRILAALLVGPLLSVIIEICQGLFLPDRVASAVDVATNSLGATIGVLLAWSVSRLIVAAPKPE